MVVEASPTKRMADSCSSPFDPIWMGLKGCEVVVQKQTSLNMVFLDHDIMKLLSEMFGDERISPLREDDIIKVGWNSGTKPLGF